MSKNEYIFIYIFNVLLYFAASFCKIIFWGVGREGGNGFYFISAVNKITWDMNTDLRKCGFSVNYSKINKPGNDLMRFS